MRIPGLGLEIRRTPKVREKAGGLTTLSTGFGSGWFSLIHEPSTGAWQRNQSINTDDTLTNPTAWSCITLIAQDIAKLWINLVEKDANGICTPTDSSAFSPVLRKPNTFSTRVKFFEYWMLSKLTRGNTYVLKARDNRGVVKALYILDPSRVAVLIAPDGSVFYQLGTDSLSRIENSVVVPAREIIHDIMVPLFHPLVGVSPIFACGVAALQGLKIQNTTTKLFSNGINPGGFLSSPHHITNEVADRLRKDWQENYAGEENIGRLAIGGDGLDYKPLSMTAVDVQLIDQLKWGDEKICACFHVPGYMVGIGPAPPYTDIQSINLQYYTQALQNPIENIEVLLDEGLELPTAPTEYHVEFDLAALLRMDSKTQTAVWKERIGAGFATPNQARAEHDWKPVDGGDSCYLQQQNFSLEALAQRDAAGPPPPTPVLTTTPPQPDASLKDFDADDVRQKALALLAA